MGPESARLSGACAVRKSRGDSVSVLAVILAVAGVAWFRRKLWGWWLAVGIIATQVLGGLVHLATGRIAEGAVGTTVSAFLLAYLLRRRVKAEFSRTAP